MSNLDELLSQRAALDAEIARQRKEQVAAARQQILNLMATHGLSLRDLGKVPSLAPKFKVAAKYRDPKTGNTWSGRGLQPRWLRDQVAAGAKLESFSVS